MIKHNLAHFNLPRLWLHLPQYTGQNVIFRAGTILKCSIQLYVATSGLAALRGDNSRSLENGLNEDFMSWVLVIETSSSRTDPMCHQAAQIQVKSLCQHDSQLIWINVWLWAAWKPQQQKCLHSLYCWCHLMCSQPSVGCLAISIRRKAVLQAHVHVPFITSLSLIIRDHKFKQTSKVQFCQSPQ